MNTSRFLFASLLVCAPALAAPTGKLGFIGAKGAQILNLGSGQVKSLPSGTKATMLALSPRGRAVYFVPIAGADGEDGSGSPSNGFLSVPPYTRAKAVAALRGQTPYSLRWNERGTTLYLSGLHSFGAFSPALRKLSLLAKLPENFAQSGSKVAYATANQIILRDAPTAKERVLFDVRRPAPMFAALKRARNPKNVTDLLTEASDLDVKDTHNWQLSDPALSPDGSRLYFASNAGTGYGAAGNGQFALFAVNLKTNTLSVLSKLGTNFGRPPHIFRVSPDGKRLLVATSVHSSAADNSCFAYVVDLLTQNSREVFTGVLPGSKNKANFLDSAVWSPDGKYVALSGYFYDAEKAMTSKDEGSDPEPAQYTTGIVDAATGRLIRTIQGATSLGWAR